MFLQASSNTVDETPSKDERSGRDMDRVRDCHSSPLMRWIRRSPARLFVLWTSATQSSGQNSRHSTNYPSAFLRIESSFLSAFSSIFVHHCSTCTLEGLLHRRASHDGRSISIQLSCRPCSPCANMLPRNSCFFVDVRMVLRLVNTVLASSTTGVQFRGGLIRVVSGVGDNGSPSDHSSFSSTH